MATTIDRADKQRAAALRQQEIEKQAGIDSKIDPSFAPGGQRATLIQPDTGEKVTTEVGSQDAQRLFGLGMKLDTSGRITDGTAPPTDVAPPSDSKYYKPSSFSDAMKTVAGAAADNAKNLAIGAPDSYDNQILHQQAALRAARLGMDLTPDDLKWLNPDQVNAVNSGEEKLLLAQEAYLNKISQNRRDAKKEEEAKVKEEEAKALAKAQTTFDIYNQIGFDKLDETERSQLETQLGITPGTLADVVDSYTEEDKTSWQLGSDANGNKIKYRFNEQTGDYESEIIDAKIKTGNGSKESDDEKQTKDFISKAADYLTQVFAGDLTIDQAVSLLSISFPDYDSGSIRAYLTENSGSTSSSSVDDLVLSFYGL